MLGSAFFAYRFGWWLLALIIPIFVLSLATRDVSSGLMFISTIAMGGLSGLVIKNRFSLAHYTIVVPLLTTVLFSGDYYYQKIYKGTDIIVASKEQVVKYLEQTESTVEDKEAMLADINVFLEIIKSIVPFSIFLYTLMFSALCYLIVKRFFMFMKRETSESSLAEFDLNAYLVFAFILAWACVLLAGKQMGELYIIILNGALIMSALYFIQALGVISFFLKKKKMPDYLLVILVLIILIFSRGVGAFLAIILTGLGLLDLWADFRKIRTKKKDV